MPRKVLLYKRKKRGESELKKKLNFYAVDNFSLWITKPANRLRDLTASPTAINPYWAG
jgi:hypothetical protein